MKVLYLLTGSLVLFTGLLTVPVAPAQSASPAAPSDYSFTISTAQPWTDTGLDLQAGAVLQIKASVGQNCDPAGISGTASTDLPEMSAPAGSLIGKLQATGAPIRVGADKQLTVEKSGHLFLGVNSSGTSPCNGSFAVKVHLTPGPPVSSSSSTASPAAASPAAKRRGPHPRKTSSRSFPAQPRCFSPDSSAPVQLLPPVRPQRPQQETMWSPQLPRPTRRPPLR